MAEQAGLKVLQIINEPTAASLAYGLLKKLTETNNIKKEKYDNILNIDNGNNDNRIEKEDNIEEKLIIVFDLGGGTFDVTLLGIEEQDFKVISTSGNTHLGGDDFDKRIIDYCLNEFRLKFNFDLNKIRMDKTAMNRLKVASEKAKIKLSFEETTNICINEFYRNELLNIKLTRKKFEEICEDLFDKLIDPLFKVLNDGNKDITRLKEIVFVGGSTRIPRIKELIHNKFLNVNINDSINPDEAVAYGAAIQAAILMNGDNAILNDIILLDITPFSLGVDVKDLNQNSKNKKKGNIMSIIIPKGSKIPVEKTQYFTTVVDNQESLDIRVFEGENKYAKDNQLLGMFKLVDLSLKPKGEIKINVNFNR